VNGAPRVALLAGGTGGAKLAAGMQELIGDRLAVIANTADDCEVHGLRVSPDPDLITYWLAGEIDEERGWGIKGDSNTVHERLEALGAPGWFQLTDRDLATCLYRTQFLAAKGTLSAAQAQIARALGVTASVLPMCEEPVGTRVRTAAGWRGLQEFLILDRGEGPLEGVEIEGLAKAPDPLGAGTARGNRVRARARDRGQPAGRRAVGEGPDRGVHGRHRKALHGGRCRIPVRGAPRRHGRGRGRPRAPATGPDGLLLPGADGGAGRAARTGGASARSGRDAARMRATAIVPVKRFGAAKRRLGDALDNRARTALIGAMLEDVLAALGRATLVEQVIVVTGEKRAERIAMRAAAQITTPLEVLREPSDHGHSEAAVLGIIRAIALGAGCVSILPGDCPLIDSGELDAALGRAEVGRVAVIPDRHGSGTNGLILAPPDAIGPAFGPGSRERHLERATARDLEAVLEPLPSLSLDLDTADDLAALAERLTDSPELAPRTAAALGG